MLIVLSVMCMHIVFHCSPHYPERPKGVIFTVHLFYSLINDPPAHFMLCHLNADQTQGEQQR